MAYLGDAATEKPGKAKKDHKTHYIDAIDRYERGTEKWRMQAEKIIKIYLDQHRTDAAPRRFALLWANIETLKPAVYARLPVAVVSRRFKDADPVGRKAGEVLERCINSSFDLYGVNDVMECVRDDRLLASRGTAWVRYEADFEERAGEDTDDPEANDPAPGKIEAERVCVEYVHWADFGHSLNRTWPEVTLVWRRVYMTKAKVTERFGKDKAEKLNYEVRPEYAQRYGPEIKEATDPQAIIFEIWDKPNKCVCWLAKEEKIELESGDPPLNFREFWPCPKPTYGTKATGSLVPTPDYRYYQDQAEEIDDLTQRIADLTSWLKLKAFVPGGPSSEGADAIKRMLTMQQQTEGNAIFVEVESWAGFAEKGGAKGLMDWLPLDMVMVALKGAIEARQQLKEDAYEITGISDILRGETDPNETLGAQEIKAQTGSRRIATTQRDLARFARDLAELVGEVIAEVFQPQTMADMSGFDLTLEPPPELVAKAKALVARVQPPMMPMGQMGQPPQPNPQDVEALKQAQSQLQDIQANKQVIELLRDERTRGYRIEIETDSTIEPDEQAEKQRRVEFLGAVGEFLQKSLPVAQAMPGAGPMIGEMLMFMVRGFRAGRQLEDIIEQATQQLAQAAQQPQPPDPKVEAEKVKAEAAKQKAELDAQGQQQKLQIEREKAQLEMQTAQAKQQMEMQKMQAELQKQAAELGMMREKMGLEAQAMQQKASMEAESMDRQAQAEERSATLQGEQMERKHELGLEVMDAKAKQAKANGARKTNG